MVSTSRTRRVATVAAMIVATAFGTAVLASGWHRPSDSIGAPGTASVNDRPPSRGLLVVLAAVLVVFLSAELWRSLDADGLRTVAYVPLYIGSCVVIDVVGIGVVYLFAALTGDRARWRRDLSFEVRGPNH